MNMIPVYILAGLALLFGLLLVLLEFIGRNTHHDNVDLYPPPGPPRPAPAPRKVVPFPPVQPQPDMAKILSFNEQVNKNPFKAPRMVISAETVPKPPRPGETITFAPWMTEEQKQRIIEHWRKENFE